MKSHKKKIINIGNEYESKSFKLIAKATSRLLNGFFYFKKRKGELLAGAATFFSILSFCPVILLFISLTGHIFGDVNIARDYVLDVVNANFPSMAPWILDSIKKIVNSQLTGTGTFNGLNIFLLFYSCLGVISSMIFGLHYTSKTESKGGFILEDFKSMSIGLIFTLFSVTLLVTSNKSLFFALFNLKSDYAVQIFDVLFKGNFLASVLSLGFFTFFYKFSMDAKVETKDAFLGALSFVTCFIMGKSFHWIYMNVAKEGLTQTYGNFETIMISVLWVYFLMCSFYYGASVAYAKYDEIYGEQNNTGVNLEIAEAMPSLPSDEEKKSA